MIIDIERIANDRALEIAVDGASRGFMPVDLFSALAQIVANREPEQIFNYLNALERVVQMRPAILGQNAPSSESTQ